MKLAAAIALLASCAPVTVDAARVRQQTGWLTVCLSAIQPGFVLQRGECCERYPEGVDLFEADKRAW